MIGAICLKFNEKCRAKIYLVGTYSYIDWKNECSTELGEKFVGYKYNKELGQPSVINVTQSLNGEYILRLVETKRYVIKIENDDGLEPELPHFQNEGNKFLKCDKDRDSVIFQFINYLGRSKIYFNKMDMTLSFEVIPDKMNYEDDYIRLTEALADACSELLLDYSGPTSNIYRQSKDSKKTLLEQFIFLRKFCYGDNLRGLIEAIKRNPDRVLDQEEELKPIGSGMPSKKFFQKPFSYSRGWVNLTEHKRKSGIYSPEMVSVTRKFDSLDTPANRFVKYALHKFDSICVDLVQSLQVEGQNMQAECIDEAKAIHNIIEDILKEDFFGEVGILGIMPQNNQILQKREGYSQIFAAYVMMDLALQLDWKGKDEVYEGESKNVALLYEYWLFFELYKIIKSIEGCKSIKTEENPFLLLEDGITILLEEGKKSCQSFEIKKYGIKINLYYNRTFSSMEFRTTKYEGSYSRPFRPDYTMAIFPLSFTKGQYNGEEEAIVAGAVSYIHFDAKYRISDLSSFIGDNKKGESDESEFVETKIGSVVNTYKRGDLLKMHTYNDAIRRTIGSYVLYPGSYNINSKRNETFSLYDEILPGVGAFSIKPSIGVLGENELKSFIVSLIECKKANNSRLNRLKYYTEMILSEPSMFKEQGVKYNSESKSDMYVIGYIRAASQKDYYYFLKKNGFLHTGSEFFFYFYAIKGKDVYSHHKDIFRATHFRFYINQIHKSNTYMLEPIVCKIISNELISKSELVNSLRNMGFETDENSHYADFYYVLKVKVEIENYRRKEIKITEVNNQNGNDTFSPYSPKVMFF